MHLLVFGWLLLLVSSGPLNAVSEWEVLRGCRLVVSPINDGDSFLVLHEDRVLVIRLYAVDAPEIEAGNYPRRLREQADYFGVETKRIEKMGQAATDFAADYLRNGFTVYTRYEDGWGQGRRYLGIVETQEGLLCQALVRAGLARVHGLIPKTRWPGGPDPRTYERTLKHVEATAKRGGKGAWGKE